MAANRRRSRAGIEVPGGVVLVRLRRWSALLRTIPFPTIYTADLIQRDIVIRDASRSRELYREGPYTGTSVKTPLSRVLAEIEDEGLDQFIRKRQIEASQLGTVTAPSGRLTWVQESAMPYRWYRWRWKSRKQ